MSILIQVLGCLAVLVVVAVFWWAMIEAQEQAGRENENRTAWQKTQEDDRRWRRERNKR